MKEGLPFDIDLDDIVIPDVWPVLGIPIDLALGRGRRKPEHTSGPPRISKTSIYWSQKELIS